MVGFLAHNHGQMTWRVSGASVQGYNVRGLGLLTMGEAWHNNHHAFPESARLGLEAGQHDPGWWLLSMLKRCGLVDELVLPQDLPSRPELVRVDTTPGRAVEHGHDACRHSGVHADASICWASAKTGCPTTGRST